jgi:uncharacterized RDD family membrane protein YckC
MHKIVDAPLLKRAFAALLDLIFALFVGLGFFALAQYCFLLSSNARNAKEAILQEALDSSLYYRDDSGNAVSYDGDASRTDYVFYQGIISAYYADYLPKKDSSLAYDFYWYNVHILGLEDSKKLYGNDVLSSPSNEGAKLWMYSDAGVDVLGVPNAAQHEGGLLSADLSSEGKAALLLFYHDASGQKPSVYYNALNHHYHQSFANLLRATYSLYSTTYPLAVAVPLAALIFYLLFPLLFADGETLAKKLLGLGLVNRYGFKVSKAQIVLRQLPSILIISLPFLFLSPLQSGALIFGLLGISYAFVLFDKEHRALHDFWGLTRVIDTKESLFFASLAEQNLAEEQYQKLMASVDQSIQDGKAQVEDEKTISGKPNEK